MAKESQKSFVLRIDPVTMKELERWAEDEFRSVNGQLQWIIAEALRRSGRLKKSKKKQTDENSVNESDVDGYGRAVL